MDITIRVEWDMGHRLPNHGGLCRQLHGHRYAAEVTISGVINDVRGDVSEGMVADFGPVKAMVREALVLRDHCFVMCNDDPLAQKMSGLPGMVFVDYVPTAENLAADLLQQLRVRLQLQRWGEVSRLRLYETPTSWADAS